MSYSGAMALTYTPPGELGSKCPEFSLPGTDGKQYSLESFKNAPALVVMFICNHCPYVQAVEERLVHTSREFLALNAAVVAISSNDAFAYPADSFEAMRARAQEKQYPFPYLYDESQQVAKIFGAVCTPDFFVFDKDLRLSYRGRLDDSWKNPEAVTKQELRHAVLELLQNRPAPQTQYPSMGCSIKWR